MSDVAALIADMVRAGVDPDLIGRAAAAIAGREVVGMDAIDARSAGAIRQERYRLRNKASQSVTSDITRDALSPSEVSPAPLPNNHNPNTPSPPKGGSVPAGFDAFWSLYPNKVGKADAIKAFSKAILVTDLETIMAGLRRYVAKTDDRPWCNPATFLNGGRWDDQPAAVAPLARGSPSGRPAPIDHFRNFASELNGQERDDRGPGGDWDDAPGVPIRTIEHHG